VRDYAAMPLAGAGDARRLGVLSAILEAAGDRIAAGAALERALAARDVAAFIVEPIQGHGVHVAGPDYLREVARLCKQHGTLFVADEVQTGLGRTGRMWAVEHWGAEPDMILMAKALSGGFVPVGAVGMRKEIFDKLFSSMIRAPIHGSTFSKNNLAMAAGIATLRVMKEENLVEHAAKLGEGLIADLRALVDKHEFLHEVRGKGMMIALEFGEPRSLTLRAAWKLLETAQPGLFSQMITIPLFQRHRILSQVAGHNSNVVKFLPPLVISEEDRRAIRAACDEVIGDAHKVPGSIWDLGKTLAGHALKARRAT